MNLKSKIKNLIDKASPKALYKCWRIDCNLWEEQIKILWVIKYYRYSIFVNGKIDAHIKLTMYPNPNYLKRARESKVYVGRKEFEEKYNGNKWIVPINKEIDLDMA